MPRDRLERTVVLHEVRQLERQQRVREGVMNRINGNPELKQAYEVLVKNVPEEQREEVMSQIARQTQRAVSRSQTQQHTRGVAVGRLNSAHVGSDSGNGGSGRPAGCGRQTRGCQMGCAMPSLNIIGPAVIKLRFERGWSQETLAARLQCQDDDITRDVLANIESGRTQVTDKHIMAFQKVFGVQLVLLFPGSVQELDAQFARREAGRSSNAPPQRKHYFRR